MGNVGLTNIELLFMMNLARYPPVGSSWTGRRWPLVDIIATEALGDPPARSRPASDLLGPRMSLASSGLCRPSRPSRDLIQCSPFARDAGPKRRGEAPDPVTGERKRAGRVPGGTSAGRSGATDRDTDRTMYAIFENGSHQYRVSEGDFVTVDRHKIEPHGHRGRLRQESCSSPASEGPPVIGTPLIPGARVVGTIVTRQFRDKKIIIQKFRRRKNMRRQKRGHRQPFTTLQIKVDRVRGERAECRKFEQATGGRARFKSASFR